MIVNEDLVRQLIAERLAEQPSTRELYWSDAVFHAAVEQCRVALVAVVAAMRTTGVPYDRAEAILRTSIARVLDDRRLAEEQLARDVTDTGIYLDRRMGHYRQVPE